MHIMLDERIMIIIHTTMWCVHFKCELFMHMWGMFVGCGKLYWLGRPSWSKHTDTCDTQHVVMKDHVYVICGKCRKSLNRKNSCMSYCKSVLECASLYARVRSCARLCV